MVRNLLFDGAVLMKQRKQHADYITPSDKKCGFLPTERVRHEVWNGSDQKLDLWKASDMRAEVWNPSDRGSATFFLKYGNIPTAT